MPERFGNEVVSDQERGVARILCPASGVQERLPRSSTFPEYAEPKWSRLLHASLAPSDDFGVNARIEGGLRTVYPVAALNSYGV